MATTTDFEEEVKDLKVKNTELVQKVQFWKVKSAQLENDKLDLMKENNDLRLKLSRLRSGGAAQARALDSALQTSSEEAISHLVQASTAVARTLELAKTYMRDHEDLVSSSPRWSSIGGTPTKDKVHKVAPMLMGGRSIQPYVTLDRINLNNSLSSGNANQNRNVTQRVLPLPMHSLHDAYIPLQRLDPSELRHSQGVASSEDTDPDDNEDQEDIEAHERNENETEEDQENIMDEDENDYNSSRQLNVVHEDSEPEELAGGAPSPRPRFSLDNPMEGPSWLLDGPRRKIRDRPNLEPDSTTEPERNSVSPATRTSPVISAPLASPSSLASFRSPASPAALDNNDDAKENIPQAQCSRQAFTPTVRRRRRSATPPPGRPDALDCRRNSLKKRNSGRVLKVLVPKMEWYSPGAGEPSPRAARAGCSARGAGGAGGAGCSGRGAGAGRRGGGLHAAQAPAAGELRGAQP